MSTKYFHKVIVVVYLLFIGCGGGSSNANSGLIATSQDLSLNEDTAISIKLSSQSNNPKILTYYIVQQPSHGKLTGVLPNIKYTPENDYYGNDSFTFKVNNEGVDSLPAVVKIKIKPINDIPTVNAGNDINITIGSNVTFNEAVANDIDGNISSYTWKENGVILSTSKIFSKNNFAQGEHTITLTVTDNNMASATDTLSLKVGKYVKSKAFLNKGRNIITYNLDENPLVNKYDNNLDGVPESIHSYTYNSSGYKSSETYDTNADGTPDIIKTYTYDSDGHELSVSIDENADGVVDRLNTSTYDVQGNKLTYSYGDANGVPYTIFSTTFSSLNKPLITTITDNHGTHVSSIYTYDIDGNLLSRAYDSNTDYNLDVNTSYTYDSAGHKLSYNLDVNNDGTFDSTYTYKYDINGHLSALEIDNNADGIIDSTYDYLFDESGNKLSESYDADNDGAFDKVTTYIYDENNNLLNKIDDNNGDAIPDTITNFIYQNGNLIEVRVNDEIVDSYEWIFVY